MIAPLWLRPNRGQTGATALRLNRYRKVQPINRHYETQ